MGTACYVKRAAEIVAALQAAYGIEAGQTTPDGKLSITAARCLGSCGLAPVLILDGEVLAREVPETSVAAVARAKAAQSEWAAIPIPARAETIAAWHDAKKYRDLMAKQPGINKRAQAAPPPAVKATASGTANSMQKAKAQEVSGRLKKTGRTEDAAAVLLARMQKG
jgi:hypothetical protein